MTNCVCEGKNCKLDEISSSHGSTSGYTYGCRCDDCRAASRAYRQKYYNENREYHLSFMAEWRVNNRERYLKICRDYYWKNKGSILTKSKMMRIQGGMRHENEKLCSRRYREKNWRKIQEYRRQYRIDNKEAISTIRKAAYKDNADKMRKIGREYYWKNREARREYAKLYRATRPDALVFGKKAYSKRVRLAAHGCVTSSLVKKIMENPCSYCGAQSEHLDHIYPLAKGGRHCLENLAASCAKCNLSKSDKIIDDPPRAVLKCTLEEKN